jgi:nucleoside 2-deoxyribosyltransferase
MISKRSAVGIIVMTAVAPLVAARARQATAQAQPGKRLEANPMKIYLASPLGFSEVGRAFYHGTLIPEVRRAGLEVVDPWTLTAQDKIDVVLKMPYGPAKRDAWRDLNKIIGGNNRNGIDDSQMVLAVLDGVDVDSGTAAEVGYAFAKGKAILGYRGDFRLSADNEGSTVNLQVEYFIRQSGGDIITAITELGPALAKLKALASQKPK